MLIRQIETQCNKLGAAAAGAAGQAAKADEPMTMKKMISLASGREKCYIYTGWIAAGLSGTVLPAFIFMLGPIFDAMGPENDPEESLKLVAQITGIMAGLAILVFITSYLQYALLSRGAALVVNRIKAAQLKSVLEQEVAWYEQNNYNELPAKIAR